MNGFAALLIKFKLKQSYSKILPVCTLFTIGIWGKIFSHEIFFIHIFCNLFYLDRSFLLEDVAWNTSVFIFALNLD